MAIVHNLVVILPGGSAEKEGLKAHVHKLTLAMQNHTGTPSAIEEDMVDEPDDAVSNYLSHWFFYF